MYVREYLVFNADVLISRQGKGQYGHSANGPYPRSTKMGSSKANRQRVLAAALLQIRRFCILDEPTTGLDPNQLWNKEN